MSKNSVAIALVSLFFAGLMFVGCSDLATDNPDYLHAKFHFIDVNGLPASNLKVTDANVTFLFEDGSALSYPLNIRSRTDSDGKLEFVTGDLHLQKFDGYCTKYSEVCVDINEQDNGSCRASYMDCLEGQVDKITFDMSAVRSVYLFANVVSNSNSYNVTAYDTNLSLESPNTLTLDATFSLKTSSGEFLPQ